jgi:rhodanese-related sulfurtransferase
MGNSVSKQNIVNFEDVQKFVSERDHVILNVMDDADQDTLISKTLSAVAEVDALNTLMDDGEFDRKILVYGRNGGDVEKVLKKQKQLVALGFTEVYIYLGGLFEWVLLQDIYGTELFKTTRRVADILRYKK